MSEPVAARLQALARPAPAAALGLLLLNDLYLKQAFGNAFTGKLSDFAGVYLFAAFWTALLPGRGRAVALAVAVAWIAWKTPLSQPLLEAWNGLGILPLARVMDVTDLAALLVLPFACAAPVPARAAWARMAGPAMAAACVFAFAATSVYRPPVPIPNAVYRLPLPAEEVLARLYALRLDHGDDVVPFRLAGQGATRVWLTLPPRDSAEAGARAPDALLPTVDFEVSELPGGSELRLVHATMNGRWMEEDSIRARFQREVVERVRLNRANPFPRPPRVAGADRRFAPRVLAPHTLTQARGQVTVSLARPAYVALIEVGVDQQWRVIYPVDSVPLLPAGTSRLRTLCATTKVRGDYGPADAVPPCGVALPLTPRTAPAADSSPPMYRHYGRSGRPRLLMLATDAPLSRLQVEDAIRRSGFRTTLRYDWELQDALGRLVRRSGGDRAAASEIILRR